MAAKLEKLKTVSTLLEILAAVVSMLISDDYISMFQPFLRF